MELSYLELRILRELNLRGYVKWGRVSMKRRRNVIEELQEKELLSPACRVTQKGIEASRSFNPE